MFASSFENEIRSILATADLDIVTSKAVRKQLEKITGKDLTPFKQDLKSFIKIIFDEVSATRNGPSQHASNGTTATHETSVKSEPSPPSVSIQNHHHHDPSTTSAITLTSKRKATLPAPSLQTRKKVKSDDVMTDFEDGDRKEVVQDGGKEVAEDGDLLARYFQEEARRRVARRDSTSAPNIASKSAPSSASKSPVKKKNREKAVSQPNVGVKKLQKAAAPPKKRVVAESNKLVILSPPLAEFLGKSVMSRPDVVKQLWVYIKGKGLQDERNRKEIICDEALQGVFKVPKMGIFEINKLLMEHVTKVESVKRVEPVKKESIKNYESFSGDKAAGMDSDHDVDSESDEEDDDTYDDEDDDTYEGDDDEEDDDTDDEDDYESEEESMLKPKKEARGAIRASKVVKAANSKSKRTEDHIPMVLSNPLSAFLGGEKLLSKAEVEKRLWVYIKAKSLQDLQNKRYILFDDALKEVFQKPWTTQFLIGRILKPHLTKPEEIVNHVMMPEKDAFMAMDVASLEEYSGDEDFGSDGN